MTPIEAELAAQVEAVFAHPASSLTTARCLPEPRRARRSAWREARRMRHGCMCGHSRLGHEHYSASTHCACCRCLAFERALTGWGIVLLLTVCAAFWFGIVWMAAR